MYNTRDGIITCTYNWRAADSQKKLFWSVIAFHNYLQEMKPGQSISTLRTIIRTDIINKGTRSVAREAYEAQPLDFVHDRSLGWMKWTLAEQPYFFYAFLGTDNTFSEKMFLSLAFALCILVLNPHSKHAYAQVQPNAAQLAKLARFETIGDSGISWSDEPVPFESANPYPSSFGIKLLERSEEPVPDRDFTVPLIEVVENIYNNRNNRSELVREYAWPNNEIGLRMGAVQGGLEEGLPITFTNRLMVQYSRWLAQVYKPYKWTKFQCIYGWFINGKIHHFVIAEGNFTSFKTSSHLQLNPALLNTQTA
ncbi:MAG: hypothetical protein LQ339_006013 [Xanthoria mediterranea]|nr:MAG: hypothetical protein LQ339_006013 [Xanthoria mediterranea]